MKTKKILSISFVLFIFQIFAIAQEAPSDFQPYKVGDEDLKKFVKISQEMNNVQLSVQQQMIEKVNASGMDVEKFNQISNLTQSTDQLQNAGVTEEDMALFQEIMVELQVMQEGLNGEMQKVLSEEGMSMETYSEIMNAYQQDPKVQEKVNQMLAPID